MKADKGPGEGTGLVVVTRGEVPRLVGTAARQPAGS